ncbi:NAD-dependent epimerase/dehydratase family protein [Paenibacillus aceti]|uniref:NAD-dependent epimerase/dehydratase domain-containing protein n=1 Tax=Paenibacillus aceti TaxID=1820010 RepID=A0ABQ1VVG1_9BACL|nr:NAD-dependent epimerase/dehydratase family protein [Paenibacillus aceti]GGG00422.1 hypothetical protein GCM10010913_22730 [Paenibacillus aceti]
MKVLVTGGYGFIGSFVAARFYQEGHDVIIIDNISTGHVKHVEFPHTSYIIDVESPHCASIFTEHSIDIVVHLAAQINIVTSMEDPYADTKSNILGLTNMLQLAAKHKVKKFIFASSAAVYGLTEAIPLTEDLPCRPISTYGINKLLGEYYCSKWSELYHLDTLCFRFANVYGPRQGLIGEGGVISIFMGRIIGGQSLTLYGDGEQTRDFIYVEDVADAIYTASQSPLTGIMNLSTNTEHSVNTLIQVLSGLHPLSGIHRAETRSGDIFRSVLDNSLLHRSLDWKPCFSLEEGLSRTYEWFASSAALPTPVFHSEAAATSTQPSLNEAHIENELLNSSRSRHIRSLYMNQNEHYLEGSPVLKPQIFRAVLYSRERAKQKFNTDYTILELLHMPHNQLEELHIIDSHLRENDYIGLDETEAPQILLSNASSTEAAHVVNRLERHGIAARIRFSSDQEEEVD